MIKTVRDEELNLSVGRIGHTCNGYCKDRTHAAVGYAGRGLTLDEVRQFFLLRMDIDLLNIDYAYEASIPDYVIAMMGDNAWAYVINYRDRP